MVAHVLIRFQRCLSPPYHWVNLPTPSYSLENSR
nr:MAG TPA: hypothetical protein [Caudoviricetes sp.]